MVGERVLTNQEEGFRMLCPVDRGHLDELKTYQASL